VDLFSLGAAGVVPGGERLRRIASDAKLQSVAPPTPVGRDHRPARRKCFMQALAIVEVAIIKPWLEASGRSRGKKRRGHELGEPPAGEFLARVLQMALPPCLRSPAVRGPLQDTRADWLGRHQRRRDQDGDQRNALALH